MSHCLDVAMVFTKETFEKISSNNNAISIMVANYGIFRPLIVFNMFSAER